MPVNHSVPAFLRLGGDDCDVLDQTALQNDEHPDAYVFLMLLVLPAVDPMEQVHERNTIGLSRLPRPWSIFC